MNRKQIKEKLGILLINKHGSNNIIEIICLYHIKIIYLVSFAMLLNPSWGYNY